MEDSVMVVGVPTAEVVAGSHVAYQITCRKGTMQWRVYRRFGDFYKLHKNLKAIFSSGLPSLPPKKIRLGMSKFEKTFIDTRRVALEKYLQAVVGAHDPETVDTLNDFLEYSENFLLGTTQSLTGITELQSVTRLLHQAMQATVANRRAGTSAPVPVLSSPGGSGAGARRYTSGSDSGRSGLDSDEDGGAPATAPPLLGSPQLAGLDVMEALEMASEQLTKYLGNLISTTEDLEAEFEAKTRVQGALAGRLGARRQDLDEARSKARAERERTRRDCQREQGALDHLKAENQVLLREGKLLAGELQSLDRRRQTHLKYVERFTSAIDGVRRQQLSLLQVGPALLSSATGVVRPAGGLPPVAPDGPPPGSSVSNASSGWDASQSDGDTASSAGHHLRLAPSPPPSLSPAASPGPVLTSDQLARSAAAVETGVWVLPVRRVAGPSGTGADGSPVLEALLLEAPKSSRGARTGDTAWVLMHGTCARDEAPERAALRVFKERVALLDREAGMSMQAVAAARVAGAFGTREDPGVGDGDAGRHSKVMLVVLPQDERGAFAGAKGGGAATPSSGEAWLSRQHRWITADAVEELEGADTPTQTFAAMGLLTAGRELSRHEPAFAAPSPLTTPVVSGDGGDGTSDAGEEADVEAVLGGLAAGEADPLACVGMGLGGQAGELGLALNRASEVVDVVRAGIQSATRPGGHGDGSAPPTLPDLDELRSSIHTLPQCLVSGLNADVLTLLESALLANVSLLHRYYKWKWLPKKPKKKKKKQQVDKPPEPAASPPDTATTKANPWATPPKPPPVKPANPWAAAAAAASVSPANPWAPSSSPPSRARPVRVPRDTDSASSVSSASGLSAVVGSYGSR